MKYNKQYTEHNTKVKGTLHSKLALYPHDILPK